MRLLAVVAVISALAGALASRLRARYDGAGLRARPNGPGRVRSIATAPSLSGGGVVVCAWCGRSALASVEGAWGDRYHPECMIAATDDPDHSPVVLVADQDGPLVWTGRYR